MTDRVCICGLPTSGNRLVRRFLQHHGVPPWIKHFPIEGEAKGSPKAIVVTRRPDAWWPSVQASADGNWKIPTYAQDGGPFDFHRANAERMARIGIEWHPKDILYVQYEMIVAAPEAAGRMICEFVGVTYKGWPEAIKDGNKKWLHGQAE